VSKHALRRHSATPTQRGLSLNSYSVFATRARRKARLSARGGRLVQVLQRGGVCHRGLVLFVAFHFRTCAPRIRSKVDNSAWRWRWRADMGQCGCRARINALDLEKTRKSFVARTWQAVSGRVCGYEVGKGGKGGTDQTIAWVVGSKSGGGGWRWTRKGRTPGRGGLRGTAASAGALGPGLSTRARCTCRWRCGWGKCARNAREPRGVWDWWFSGGDEGRRVVVL